MEHETDPCRPSGSTSTAATNVSRLYWLQPKQREFPGVQSASRGVSANSPLCLPQGKRLASNIFALFHQLKQSLLLRSVIVRVFCMWDWNPARRFQSFATLHSKTVSCSDLFMFFPQLKRFPKHVSAIAKVFRICDSNPPRDFGSRRKFL